ncbi:MAG: tRNA (adenosine(37)-N6)-threonylcarbamoyltransferase complex ATPase subunit type 1 TsaE [Actinobacteria bacterium]|jgi:tRNA threonylcarbamoyladenosine biosynthesis protein TsaE|nr:tRNA (adenosine(37)-N6)-threonylcarbamoyltransferase complex ATPase subunit type 1 TsaE [Actinomycetota bacterium]
MQISTKITTVTEMEELGVAIAARLSVGDLVILRGELAAGKTALVRGIGAGLGIKEQISSPTFVIARRHHGPVPLTHVDLYRLLDHHNLSNEVSDLDLEADLITGIVVVEWGDDKFFDEVRLVVAITITSPEEREVTLDWRN